MVFWPYSRNPELGRSQASEAPVGVGVCDPMPHPRPRTTSCLPRYLMKFLARLAEEQEVNKMTPSNIAIVLGPNLLWPPEKEG